MSERVGVYPGSFDPITCGHMDIIQRATKIVDKLIVAVASPHHKKTFFDVQTRLQMVQGAIEHLPRVEVKSFDGLLVRFVREEGAHIVVRGLRAVSDFEYEFKMASANGRLDESIETIFLMASERQQFTSSQIVREIASLGGEVTQFVPQNVIQYFGKK